MLRSKAPLASLFGLAPGGVCRAADVATRAVRSYRTISPLPAPLARHLGGIFLLHFPWAHAPQALPGTVPCGARTFLHRCLRGDSDCLADSRRAPYACFSCSARLYASLSRTCGDLRRQTCRLLQRQLREQRPEHPVERAAVAVRARLAGGLTGRRARRPRARSLRATDRRRSAARCASSHSEPRYAVSCSLRDLARKRRAARGAEARRAILERLAHAVRRFVEHQRARLRGQFIQPRAPGGAARRQESFEAEPVRRQCARSRARPPRRTDRERRRPRCPRPRPRAPDRIPDR